MPAALALMPGIAAAQVDLSTTAIVQPASGCALSNAEMVSINLFNYGSALPSGTSFNVEYVINAGAPVVELATLSAPLLGNSTFAYTFTTPADLSAPGTYTFDASVSLPGDVNPTNDAYSGYFVNNDAPTVGGTLSGPSSPGTSGTLTLSGATGDVVQWEESEDGGLRWNALANTTESQEFAGLRTPTGFRVRVRSGGCADAVSNTVTVTP